ncbi:hypothetical protein GCM10009096_34130 [Parasphingorhabdus litoris]|uniref:Uncharacterized protein n=1 Tax=Parasphingorhabdus litoris TaxID=394733 RepID=A0ABN1B1I4_9SPHN|nr:hypothetical protein [Parasphingorhabdus litoris]
MDTLKQKVEVLAEAKLQKTKATLKEALAEELSDKLSVEETSDQVVVSGHMLGQDLLHNSSLRDVAFLMRGVR